jgi:hypothetical protein
VYDFALLHSYVTFSYTSGLHKNASLLKYHVRECWTCNFHGHNIYDRTNTTFCSPPFRRLCTVDTGSTVPSIGRYTAAETALYGSYVHKASAKSLRGFTIISLIIIAQELQFILSIPTSTQFSSAFKTGPTLRFSRNLFNRMLKTRV